MPKFEAGETQHQGPLPFALRLAVAGLGDVVNLVGDKMQRFNQASRVIDHPAHYYGAIQPGWLERVVTRLAPDQSAHLRRNDS